MYVVESKIPKNLRCGLRAEFSILIYYLLWKSTVRTQTFESVKSVKIAVKLTSNLL